MGVDLCPCVCVCVTESLSQILPDLLSRLQHINQSVVMLDASTLRSYALAQQAWAAVSSLYPSDAKTDMQSTNAAAPGAVSKDTLLDWVNRAQEIVRRLQDTEQVRTHRHIHRRIQRHTS